MYNYAASWKNVESETDKYKLIDSLKTLWLGRFVSYATEVQDMDINGAEKIIQEQAQIFEKNFDYLKSIYNKPITTTH